MEKERDTIKGNFENTHAQMLNGHTHFEELFLIFILK